MYRDSESSRDGHSLATSVRKLTKDYDRLPTAAPERVRTADDCSPSTATVRRKETMYSTGGLDLHGTNDRVCDAGTPWQGHPGTVSYTATSTHQPHDDATSEGRVGRGCYLL